MTNLWNMRGSSAPNAIILAEALDPFQSALRVTQEGDHGTSTLNASA